MSGASGHILTLGINGIYSPSSVTMVISGTNAVVSFIMGVGEGLSAHDSTTMLVLEIEMTIIYEKLPRLLPLQKRQLRLLSWMKKNEQNFDTNMIHIHPFNQSFLHKSGQ